MDITRNLRIEIDGGKTEVFQPGDNISGFVEYKSVSRDIVTSLILDFRGVSKIVPRKGSKFETEYTELFHMQEILCFKPIELEVRKPRSWNFDFEIPRLRVLIVQLVIGMGSPRCSRSSDMFYLLPSISCEASDEARVEYHMYAVLKRYGAMAPVVCNLEPLTFRPEVIVMDIPPRQILTKRFNCTTPPEGRLSIASFKDSGGSLVPPISNYVVTASFPPIMNLCENYIVIGLRIHTTESVFSKCFTKKVKVSIIAETHKRTTKRAHDVAQTESRTRKFFEEQYMTTWSSNDAVRCIRCSTSPLSRANYPISFKSYQFCRRYFILAEFTLSCKRYRDNVVVPIRAPIELLRLTNEGRQFLRRMTRIPAPTFEFPAGRMIEEEELPEYSETYKGARWTGPPLVAEVALAR
jgi:hypothetical protein